MNSKFIFHNCEIIWIYCYPNTDIKEQPNYEVLSNDLCIKCHKKIKKEHSIDETKLKSIAGILLLRQKVEISNRKIGKID